MVPMDLNIGFQGLALIQGQTYNPEIAPPWLINFIGGSTELLHPAPE